MLWGLLLLPILTAFTVTGTAASLDAKALSAMHVFNLAEITIGQLAAQRAQTPAVRALGARLAADFTADDESVVALARVMGLALETPGEQAQLKRLILVIPELQAATASSFDRKFLGAVERTHETGLRLVRGDARAVGDQDVRQLLINYGPQLESHLGLVQDLYPVSH